MEPEMVLDPSRWERGWSPVWWLHCSRWEHRCSPRWGLDCSRQEHELSPRWGLKSSKQFRNDVKSHQNDNEQMNTFAFVLELYVPRSLTWFLFGFGRFDHPNSHFIHSRQSSGHDMLSCSVHVCDIVVGVVRQQEG